MSLFQYAACIDGYNRSQNPDAVDPPSAEEFQAMKELHGDA